MTHESESLKQEMSAALRGDLERARQRQVAEPAAVHEPEPLPAPEHAPEPQSLGRRLRRLLG